MHPKTVNNSGIKASSIIGYDLDEIGRPHDETK